MRTVFCEHLLSHSHGRTLFKSKEGKKIWKVPEWYISRAQPSSLMIISLYTHRKKEAAYPGIKMSAVFPPNPFIICVWLFYKIVRLLYKLNLIILLTLLKVGNLILSFIQYLFPFLPHVGWISSFFFFFLILFLSFSSVSRVSFLFSDYLSDCFCKTGWKQTYCRLFSWWKGFGTYLPE